MDPNQPTEFSNSSSVNHPAGLNANQQNENDKKTQNIAKNRICAYCKASGAKLPRCGNCTKVKVYYCNQECQIADWPEHRLKCEQVKTVQSVKHSSSSIALQMQQPDVSPPSAWEIVLKDLSVKSVRLYEWDAPIYLPKTPDIPLCRLYSVFSERIIELLCQDIESLIQMLSERYNLSPTLQKQFVQVDLKSLKLPKIEIKNKKFLLVKEILILISKHHVNSVLTGIPCDGWSAGIANVLSECKKTYPHEIFSKSLNDLFEEYFSNRTISFSITTNKKSQRAHVVDLQTSIGQFFIDRLDYKLFNIFKKDIEITDEQLKIFEMKKEEALTHLKKSSCFHYALFICGEKLVKEYLLNSQVTLDKNLLTILSKRHYEPVSHPQEGDLIVYFMDDDLSTPMYMGQCTSNGTVISKLDQSVSSIFEHHLYDLLEHENGNVAVIFFRKMSD